MNQELDAIYQDWTQHMNSEHVERKEKEKENKHINRIWFAAKIGLIGLLLGTMIGGLF